MAGLLSDVKRFLPVVVSAPLWLSRVLSRRLASTPQMGEEGFVEKIDLSGMARNFEATRSSKIGREDFSPHFSAPNSLLFEDQQSTRFLGL